MQKSAGAVSSGGFIKMGCFPTVREHMNLPSHGKKKKINANFSEVPENTFGELSEVGPRTQALRR